MLARDIYRYYLEDGPPLEEKLVLAGKRLGLALAAAALGIGGLDLAGVHSPVNMVTVMRDATTQVASIENRLRDGVNSITIDPVQATRPATPAVKAAEASAKAATPKLATVSPPPAAAAPAMPSPVDQLAAARHEDAIVVAITAPAATAPAPLKPPVATAMQSASAAPSLVDLSGNAATPAAAPAQAAAMPASAAPSALAEIKTQDGAAPFSISDAAAKAEASVPPAEMQLASLTPQDQASSSAVAPTVPSMVALIPLDKVPMPPSAPPMSPADRLNLRGKEYAKAEHCLANAIYFEARSEPIRGQMAVAQVVLNRVFSGFYPSDVCSVVYQNANRHLACQFTFACDGKRKVITERGHWAIANRIARQTLDGQIYVPEVGKSTHYHAAYVHPYWTREMRRLVRFGLHSFYRPYAWGNGAGEPVWGTAALWAKLRAERATRTASR